MALELSARKGHCLANGHVAALAAGRRRRPRRQQRHPQPGRPHLPGDGRARRARRRSRRARGRRHLQERRTARRTARRRITSLTGGRIVSDQQSRKKLLNEPDEFISTSQHVWLWVTEHRDRALAIGGGVVGAVLARGRREGAHRPLARSRVRSRSPPPWRATARRRTASRRADLLPELGGLAKKYAGAPEGKVARFFEAGALAAAGELDKARAGLPGAGDGQGRAATSPPLAGVALAYLDLAAGAGRRGARRLQEPARRDRARPCPGPRSCWRSPRSTRSAGRRRRRRGSTRRCRARTPTARGRPRSKERLRLLAGSGPAAS